MIAVVTAFLAVLMIRDAAGAGGVEAALRIATGAALVVIALVVGVLVLFPEQLRKRIRGE